MWLNKFYGLGGSLEMISDIRMLVQIDLLKRDTAPQTNPEGWGSLFEEGTMVLYKKNICILRKEKNIFPYFFVAGSYKSC